MPLVVNDRVRVASQNSQFRKVTGKVVAVDNTVYTDWKGNSLVATVGHPFYVVQPDGASPDMTARFKRDDLVAL